MTNEPFPTIIAGLSHRGGTTQDVYVFALIKQGHSPRRVTPLECERLQGFPEGWTDGQSDTNRYKQLGNAVTVNVTRWIGKAIMEAEHYGQASNISSP